MHTNPHDEVDLTLRVASKTEVADGVVQIDLRDPAGADLPAWEPGSHVDVLIGPDVVRQYSLCGDTADRGVWRIAVLREPAGRGGSLYLCDELSEGAQLQVRGPRNLFPLLPSPRYVFIAGGIGITPLIPMMAAADRSGAQWELVYGGRARSSMAYREDLTRTYGERVLVRPQDETGLLDLAGLLPVPQPDLLVYCCGPEPLLLAVERQCAGWPTGALHVERFSPKQVGKPARSDSFEVELAESGLVVTVLPDQSILEVVEAAGVEVPSSCTEGTCGTCETPVLSGIPDHRDSVLDAEERDSNETMLICVSRAVSSRLVLGL